MHVEIWSDVVCPWCYLGKRRFEAALARFSHRDAVTIIWRSFELDPTAPRRVPDTLNDLLARKYAMTVAQAAAASERMTALAATEGLTYRLERAQSGNSFDAHRLLHLAGSRGFQGELKERLMKAYFTDGLPIGDRDTLVQLASEVGIDADEAAKVIAGDAYSVEVRADEERATALGISGVPFFAIAETYGISGAQPSDVFLAALEEAWDTTHPDGGSITA